MINSQSKILEEEKSNLWNKAFPSISFEGFQKIIANNLNINKLGLIYQKSNEKKPDSFFLYYHHEKNSSKGVGALELDLTPSLKICEIKELSIHRDRQANGIATQLMYNLTEALKITGVEKIRSSRTENYSFRAQSKWGFVHDLEYPSFYLSNTWEKSVSLIQSRFDQLLNSNKIDFANEAEKNSISLLINKSLPFNVKTIWLIADLKNKLSKDIKLIPEKTLRLETSINKSPDLGAFLLFNLHVQGFYDLKDMDVKERMNNYFNVKQVKKLPELEGVLKL